MDELSDESIVENTPEKKKQKTLRHKPKVKSRAHNIISKKYQSTEGEVSHILQEFVKNVIQEPTKVTEKGPYSSPNQPSPLKIAPVQSEGYKIDQMSYACLTEPIQTPFSKNSHSMYVFYSFEEILKFTPSRFPKNTNIQLVGIVRFCNKTKSFVLCNAEPVNPRYKIKIVLTEMPAKPCTGDTISVFGILSFEEQTPVLIGKFFQKLTVTYSTYVELMLKLRTTVPLENLDVYSQNNTIINGDESDDFLDSLTQNLEESSECNQLGDTMLCDFLDEISFEKL